MGYIFSELISAFHHFTEQLIATKIAHFTSSVHICNLESLVELLRLICLHKQSLTNFKSYLKRKILIFPARCLYSICFPTLSHLTKEHFSSFSLDSFDRPNSISFLKKNSFFLVLLCIYFILLKGFHPIMTGLYFSDFTG